MAHRRRRSCRRCLTEPSPFGAVAGAAVVDPVDLAGAQVGRLREADDGPYSHL